MIFHVIIFSMLIRGEWVGLQLPVKNPAPIEKLCMGVWAKNPSKQNNSIILGFDWLRKPLKNSDNLVLTKKLKSWTCIIWDFFEWTPP